MIAFFLNGERKCAWVSSFFFVVLDVVATGPPALAPSLHACFLQLLCRNQRTETSILRPRLSFFSRVKEVLKRKAKYMYTPMSMRGSGDTVNLEELSQRIGDERLTVGEALFFSFGK